VLNTPATVTALHHRVMSNHAALKIQQESREVAHRQALQERAKRRLLRKSEAQRLAMPPAIERATMQELPIVSSDSVVSVHDRATMSEPSSDATVRVLPPVEVSHPESVPVTNAAPEPGYSERSQPSIQRRTIFEVLQGTYVLAHPSAHWLTHLSPRQTGSVPSCMVHKQQSEGSLPRSERIVSRLRVYAGQSRSDLVVGHYSRSPPRNNGFQSRITFPGRSCLDE
jgi:hypothetical protein